MPNWPEPVLPNMGELMACPAELYNWLGRSFCCSRHLLGGAASSCALRDLFFPFNAMASLSAALALAAFGSALSLGGGVGTCDSVGLATGFSGPVRPGSGIWATVFTATAPHPPPFLAPQRSCGPPDTPYPIRVAAMAECSATENQNEGAMRSG